MNGDRADSPAPESTSPLTDHDATREVLVGAERICEWCALDIEGRNATRFCSPECWWEYQREYPNGVPQMTPEEREAEHAEVLARLDPDDTDSLLMIQSAADELALYTRLMGDDTNEETP